MESQYTVSVETIIDCHGKVSNYIAGGARLTMKLKTNYMKIQKHNWNKTSLFLLFLNQE